MTHVRNMQEMHKVLEYCARLGGHPGETNLHVDTLNDKLNEVRQAIDRVTDARISFNELSNKRKQAFDAVSPLASQVILNLERSGATPETLDDVRRLYKQLTGRSPKNRTPIPSEAALAQGKLRRSVGQAAYVHKAEMFSQLVRTVSTQPQYEAGNAAQTLEALQAKAAELDQLNDQIDEARAEWSNLLVARDKAMYSKPFGGIQAALRVKKYLRSAFGSNSGEYAKVKGIAFTKP